MPALPPPRVGWPGGRERSGTVLEVADVMLGADSVSREVALSIPACAACRNLIVGTIVQLHLYAYRGSERLDGGYLISKPDPDQTLVATMGGTVDDLLFYGRAYWRILDRDSEGFPRRARWTPYLDVTPLTRSTGGLYAELTGYRVAGLQIPVAPADLIRFDAAIPGVLTYGGPAFSAALSLEAAARRLAGVQLPAGVLKNEGAQVSPEEAKQLVDDFLAQRSLNGVAFLQQLTYSREQLSPSDLQMIEARANTATEIARLFNVPVAMIGASPSGNASALLYANLSQQLAILVTTAVAPHIRAIESTLSDVYPRGTAAAFDVQTFLRADPQAAADYALALLAAGAITIPECRSMLGLSTPSSAGDLTPGKV
jgi:HK97 family phage portal protein